MYQRIAFYLLLTVGLTANAQTVNLRGKVSNQAEKPIANAILTLAGQGIKDTTGSDGSYSIVSTDVSTFPQLLPQSTSITMYKGFLDFSLVNPSSVKVEIFDVKGNLLKKVSLPNTQKGFYRFNIAENSRATRVLLIRALIGGEGVTFRYFPLNKGKLTVNTSVESSNPNGGNLAKVTAVGDTLKVTATNYTTKSIAINSYNQVLNITLDTSGGGGTKRSTGCGKATTLQKDKDQAFTVTAGSAGSRRYIIRIPADYNENNPYALWFTPHCMNGTADGVAAGSAGTGYQYYGIWKFANPAGGKGTTIFCSPDGINKGWGQGAKDLQFFRYMINKFASEFCIDMSRIFSEGFSMGGSMSYALACAMPDTFRAVCMHSGGSMSGCDGSKRGPVPMFITHGTDDPTCGWPGLGAPQINDLAKRDGCQTEDLGAKCKPTDQMRPVCVEYQGCDEGYPCRACVFKGGHNPSPGTEGSWGEGNTWVPDSTWSYFKRFY